MDNSTRIITASKKFAVSLDGLYMNTTGIQANPSVFVILPVHNRKDTTLNCLRHLQNQGALEKYHIVVVDDGSTDGTDTVIQSCYPGISLLKGDGTFWWAGATRLGMEYAYANGADYFIWLNDDTLPEPGALGYLVQRCQQQPNTIVGGQCYSESHCQVVTYSGHQRHGLKHLSVVVAPEGEVECDSLNGNLVCLPRSVVDAVGHLDAKQTPHYHSETIYTWRLKQLGYKILVTDRARGLCTQNPGDPSWLASERSLASVWQRLITPKSVYYPPGFWQLCKAFWGPLGIVVFVQPYVRLAAISLLRLLPQPLLKRLVALRP